ncbi:winged helix-turn-helix domain-containing protein (plasmid) [Streptomyces sp. NBC_01717]|uniref:AfsR/SARP family transcriptional regulator n=1 Tax=Streptomyces sp. NBC_01717 TaxID=2975918 RepID=UPI002E2F03C9|nr:BTAD domain-containing putative transcriptional regulator [Streptomyces sp. NBC_01717]
MEFRLLGPLEVADEDGELIQLPGEKLRHLLALLLLRLPGPASTHQLIDELWGEHEGRDPLNALQAHVSKLRARLGSESVQRSGDNYRLAVPAALDSSRFAQLAAEGKEALRRHSFTAARRLMDEALQLWRGEMLVGIPSSSSVEAARTQLTRLRQLAEEDRTDAALALGDNAELIPELEVDVARHPYRERRRAQLMLALYRTGRQAEALDSYAELRRLLSNTLGTEPSPPLARLHRLILQHDRSLSAASGDRDDPAARPAAAELSRTEPSAPASADRDDGSRIALRKDGRDVPQAPIPSAAPAASTIGNLRAPLDRFVGRASTLESLRAKIGQHRLVTVVGTGGVGKTRTVLEVCRTIAHRYADGTWFVDLSVLGRGDNVTERVLGVVQPNDPDDAVAHSPGAQLIDGLRGRRALLILDNCEHVIDEVAELIQSLLLECPWVVVVATSREALAIDGESLLPLPPLTQQEAVELFVLRAELKRPDLPFEAGDSAIHEICAKLDRLPLAVELAASRVALLPPIEIARRLVDRFPLLAVRSRSAPPRHQTMAAALQWSYDLLTPSERRVLQALSVFAGGCTLTAAETVCGPDLTASSPLTEVLSRLIDKSLLLRTDTEANDQVRYRMLDTVREYARARLMADGRGEEVHQRMAHWLLEATAQLASEQYRLPVAYMWELTSEHANVRYTLDWLQSRDEHVCRVVLLGRLGYYWAAMGMGAEAVHWLQNLLDRKDPPGPQPDGSLGPVTLAQYQLSLAHALSWYAWLGAVSGLLADPILHAWQAVDVARLLTDTDVLIKTLGLTFWTTVSHGTLDEARVALIEADKAADAEGQTAARSPLDSLWASCHVIEGNVDAAARKAKAAVHSALRSSNRTHLLGALLRLGDIRNVGGQPEEARQHWRDVVRIACEAREDIWEIQGRFRLAYADVAAARYAAALESLNDPVFQNLPGHDLPTAALNLRAMAQLLLGRPDDAERTLLTALELLGPHGHPVRRAVTALTLRHIAQLRDDRTAVSRWTEQFSAVTEHLAPWLRWSVQRAEREMAAWTTQVQDRVHVLDSTCWLEGLCPDEPETPGRVVTLFLGEQLTRGLALSTEPAGTFVDPLPHSGAFPAHHRPDPGTAPERSGRTEA